LNDDDVDELRLPYPQVLVTIADPLALPPSATIAPEDADRVNATLVEADIAVADLVQGHRWTGGLGALLHHGAPNPADLLSGVHALDVAAVRGATVEGVLLLADSLGRLEDAFAWCLAVPGSRGGVLSRLVVPALLSATGYRPQLLNVAAVASWGAWHAPDVESPVQPGMSSRDVERAVRTREFRDLEPRGGAGAVRVLDIRRTSGVSSVSPASGRSVAPHVRRGHWRRQHHGPGGELIKRVRIAPVIVNAHRGAIAARVYRLPSPMSADPR
jgi:hypothetical protein